MSQTEGYKKLTGRPSLMTELFEVLLGVAETRGKSQPALFMELFEAATGLAAQEARRRLAKTTPS